MVGIATPAKLRRFRQVGNKFCFHLGAFHRANAKWTGDAEVGGSVETK